MTVAEFDDLIKEIKRCAELSHVLDTHDNISKNKAA